ncbi:MAG: hypothetical protein IT372_00600, partial [Polyangiaceae bacterium]|nr:hypothetical protein [Polyangiaceae bacterium]
MRSGSAILALAAIPALLAASGAARAEPQWTAGLTAGAAGVAVDRAFWDRTVFHLGLRGDVLFGRDENADVGAGPYAELLTHAFDEVQLGAGGSLLLPVLDSLPIVLSAGAYARKGDDDFGVEPGLAAALFWGSRSYNFHSDYVMSGGLLAEMRLGLGESKETSIVVGAQLDLALMAMPIV